MKIKSGAKLCVSPDNRWYCIFKDGINIVDYIYDGIIRFKNTRYVISENSEYEIIEKSYKERMMELL